jgi:hypothetical protein
MPTEAGDYTVVEVKPASPSATAEASEEATPPEVLERFEGRTFTLEELQQRGVRIAGGRAYYTASGRDWQLQLFPEPGAAS